MNDSTPKPLVSIVIPTYNCDRYIVEAIESVLNQTYTNQEIIVIDDGSTDNTNNVIKPYLSHIRYISQKNQGPSVARNRGIEEAKGEFIAFLDADDFFLENNKLAAQIACFEAQPDSGIVHSGWQRVDSNGHKIVERQPWLLTPKLDLEEWLIYNPVLPSAMMFRKEWLEKVGGFAPQFRSSEDTDLLLRLALRGCKTTWLKKITVAYRQHENNTTNQTLQNYANMPLMLDNFFSLPNIPQHILRLKDTAYYGKYVWLGWRFYSVGNFQKMAECLQKSLAYSPYSYELTENATLWIKCFNSLSREEGKKFSPSVLMKLPEWQQLIKGILTEFFIGHIDKKKKVKITSNII